mmetsp:Transcript_3725/g.12809  ORF Transcript_3725/g.12809 Transcript_3725/m.12809 type:complete len:299 (+) Transcript_3725:441-1337(+)
MSRCTCTSFVWPYRRIRPIACVSDASYSYCVFVSSGCTKMAWFAVVRLAPEADSSRESSMRTRASPGRSFSFWNSSNAAHCWWTEPLSLRYLMFASSRTSETCFMRSGYWMKIRTRSSGLKPRRLWTSSDIFLPWRPTTMEPPPAVRSPPFPPFPPPRFFLVGDANAASPSTQPSLSVPRLAAVMMLSPPHARAHPGTPHSCRLASARRHARQPTWPHSLMRPASRFMQTDDELVRLSAPVPPPPPPLCFFFADLASHAWQTMASSSRKPWSSRTALKNRSARVLPESSFTSAFTSWV